MKLSRALGAGGVGLLLVLLGATDALAWRQTQTCYTSLSEGAYLCQADELPKGILWSRRRIGYHLNERGSDDLPTVNGRMSAPLRAALNASFDAWNAPSCSDLELYEVGLTDREDIGLDCAEGAPPNINVVVWREDAWGELGPSYTRSVYALTSVTFRASSAIIADADIELNGVNFTFTNEDNANATLVDVRNTMTHEVGHFIGLDHSEHQDATMFGMAPEGELSKRELKPDDIEALCTIYPSGGPLPQGPQGPCNSAVSASGEDSCACTSVQASSSEPRPAHALLLSLMMLGVRRARRVRP